MSDARLDNPLDLPLSFKAWISKYLEVNPPALPITQMLGYQSSTPDTVNVKAPTGDATKDTAAITAAIAACPAGGVVQLQAGTYAITGLTINKSLTLKGRGGAERDWNHWGTLLALDSATAVAITQTAHLVRYENFALRNVHATAPTAGAGIQVLSGGGNSNHYGPNLTIRGFYTNIDHQAGKEWFMDPSCLICDFVSVGLRIQNVDSVDGGDMSVSGIFNAGPTNLAPQAAIKWQSGGGFRGYSIKVNAFPGVALAAGIDLELLDGVGTSDFILTGSSIENCAAGVLLQHVGPLNTGTLTKIVIVGNEFAQFASPSVCVELLPAVASRVSDVYIGGNVFTQATVAIKAQNIDNLTYGPSVYKGIGNGFSDAGGNTNVLAIVPSAQSPGHEIGYDEITTTVNVIGTTSGTPTTIIPGSAHAFDGGAVIAEFSAVNVAAPQAAGHTITVGLYEGSTLIKVMGAVTNPVAGGLSLGMERRFRFTPSAGSHTYSIKAWVSITTGTPSISGAFAPVSLRFTKA